MSLTVSAARLAREAAWIAKAIKTTYPGLSVGRPAPVEVSALRSRLRLRRTDGELFAETMVKADGGGAKAVLVDPAKLTAIAKGAIGTAEIEITDEHLMIDAGGRAVKLKAVTIPEGLVPKWPTFLFDEGVGETMISAPQLARGLTSVRNDDAFPALTVLRFDDGAMVTCDQYRLTRIEYADEGIAAQVSGAALRPFATGHEAVIIEGGRIAGDDARIGIGAVLVSSIGRTMITRVMDVDFPNWREQIARTVPEDEPSLSVMVRRGDLLKAMGRGEFVTLRIGVPDEDGYAEIEVISADHDNEIEVTQSITASSVVVGDGPVCPFRMRLNRAKLEGCLNGVTSGAIQLDFTEPTKPVIVTGAGCYHELHVLMPIRMPA